MCKMWKEGKKMTEEIGIKPYKYSISMKQDSKRNWYIGEVKIKGDNIEEMKTELDKAISIVKNKMLELG